MNGHPSKDSFNRRLRSLGSLALGGVAVGAVGWAVFSPPVPQNPAYHDFADQRTLFGVPHCLNVVSNALFLLVGVLGLAFLGSRAARRPGGPLRRPEERWPFAVFFLGVALTSVGSAYYHLDPTNERLLWDRLPMAVSFMALFAAVIAERIRLGLGLRLLPALVAAGLASVLYWYWTEQRGRGDLRPYYLVQYGTTLALATLLLFPARYTGSGHLFGALLLYVAAKFFEAPLDAPIFALGGWVSGHTLKHLAAGAATYEVLRWLKVRRPNVVVERESVAMNVSRDCSQP
jgi:hypothetical protein